MDCSAVPGISINVPLLLRGLGSQGLVNAVKAALCTGGRDSDAEALCLKARGLTLDVVEFLHGMERQELLLAVQAAVEAFPVSQKAKVMQELHSMLDGTAPYASEEGSEVNCHNEGAALDAGTRLPAICPDGDRRSAEPLGAAYRKPPRLPGTMAAGRGMGVSFSTPSLPSVSRQGDMMTASDRDARLLGDRLRRAIHSKDLPAVQALLAAHADMEQQDRAGSSATSLAMLQGTPHGILRALLGARANVDAIDGQGRSLAHLWAWTLPKTSRGVKEAQKKLALLVQSRANLDAQLPVTGDAPLHILAKLYNSLSARACDGTPDGGDEIGGQKEAEQFATCTQSRIQMVVGAGASTSARNGEGKKPLSLIEPRFQRQLLALMTQGNSCTGADGGVNLMAKGQKGCIMILDTAPLRSNCLQ